MAELLFEFQSLVSAPDGTTYRARACGAPADGGLWEGWIEFVPVAGGAAVRSGRETTQPNRTDAVYWASGLTAVYLDGALKRALNPLVVVAPPLLDRPAFDGPARSPEIIRPAVKTEAVLDPFSVYEKGEPLLRRQLAAMSAWHLVNIIQAHRLAAGEDEDSLNRMSSSTLIELIVAGVRRKFDRAPVR
jgi:hypothetical protein